MLAFSFEILVRRQITLKITDQHRTEIITGYVNRKLSMILEIFFFLAGGILSGLCCSGCCREGLRLRLPILQLEEFPRTDLT